MLKESLVVAETFYSIQGEGQTMGIPAVFVRLAGCNLLCEGTWRCDTIEVWQKGRSTSFENILTIENLAALQNGAHLVLTGGEPLLQQIRIIAFLKWLWKERKITPIIEVETNGTIMPDPALLSAVHFWNVSPKLSNSGEPYDVRVNEIVLRTIRSSGKNFIFKFVINDRDDILEIDQDYGFLLNKEIMLMPAGDTQVKLDTTREMVVDLCKTMLYRYSERLHIVIWNKKTGV